jgi:hypothetical protein
MMGYRMSFFWFKLCRRCKVRRLARRYVLTDWAGCMHPNRRR